LEEVEELFRVNINSMPFARKTKCTCDNEEGHCVHCPCREQEYVYRFDVGLEPEHATDHLICPLAKQHNPKRKGGKRRFASFEKFKEHLNTIRKVTDMLELAFEKGMDKLIVNAVEEQKDALALYANEIEPKLAEQEQTEEDEQETKRARVE
jgi:hypothetical protein